MSALSLLDWRRRVAALYEAARVDGDLARFRAGRAELFATHPESPTADRGHATPSYWPHRPDLRFAAAVDTDVDPETHHTEEATLLRIGTVHLPIGDLDVFWLEGYAGGLFLPFRDATNGDSTYGGGRYLLDTAKGADLGTTDDGELVLDFNYAYHPSCFWSERWSCPLPPPRSTLAVAVEAGERNSD